MPIQVRGPPFLCGNIFARFRSWYVMHRQRVSTQTVAIAEGTLPPIQKLKHQHKLLSVSLDCKGWPGQFLFDSFK